MLAAILAASAASSARSAPVATGNRGAVASVSELATAAGLRILDEGGNAVDAAVATAAALGVTDPFSCGIGGGGFMLVYVAAERRIVAIDHRETAPSAFRSDAFLDHGAEIPFDDAVRSGLSVGVPGTVRGWELALERFGTRTLAEVLAPAIGIAERGFSVRPQFSRFIDYNAGKFARFPATARLYLDGGRPLAPGTHFANPDMARAYRELAQHGARAFYEGPIADAIVAAVTHPGIDAGATGVRPGLMTMNDLRNYEARLRQPVRSTYRGYEIYGMPLPSSGAITVALALNMLEGYELHSLSRAHAEHLTLEASRLAFADRNVYLGDPEYVDAPVQGLLSKDYAAGRRKLIDPARATAYVMPGDPYAFQDDPSVPLRPRALPPDAARLGEESAHTTHLTVADSSGNVVAYTFTIEDWGGSGIVVPGYGFLLNNELTDFDFTPPHPNVPEPGKRPRSSMSPTIAFRNGKPAFTIGAPGGSTIITTVLQTIVNHVDFGMTFPEALAAPRLSQRDRPTTTVESGFAGAPLARELESFGHRWDDAEFGVIGYANALYFSDDGRVTAISEPVRGGGGSAAAQQSAP